MENKIIICIKGGMVQEVTKVGYARQTKIIIRDYDIDGADENELVKDEDGFNYIPHYC